MPASIHDNHVTGYLVDGELGRIVIRTEFRDRGSPFERTDIVFDGVEAYRFVHDLPGQNILFSIDVVDVGAFLAEHADEFSAVHGWPRFWRGSLSDATDRLAGVGARAFVIMASSGLNGWVIANGMRLVATEPDRA